MACSVGASGHGIYKGVLEDGGIFLGFMVVVWY